jgi:OmpA-OmpF porin, OOP family
MREYWRPKVLLTRKFDLRRHVFLAAQILAATLLPPLASAQQAASREYSDGVRGSVVLPQGDRSFADAVVAYVPGSGTIAPTARDPEQALGAPDFSGNVADGSFVSLGCDGTLTLQFTDNALVDVDGPDLYVFEVGPRVEGMVLAISEDGETWTEIGEISGGRAEVDIGGLVPPGSSFRYVRLTDDGVDCGTNYAGADIDAVAAIGSAMRFVLESSVLFEVDSAELRDEARAALTELSGQIAAAGIEGFQVIGHTDSTGSDAYNLTLSEARAAAVSQYLGTLDALRGVRITSTGRGESQPIADNGTEEGRSRNRRVEIVGQ